MELVTGTTVMESPRARTSATRSSTSKSDLTPLRLTTPETWLHGGVTIVARVEGHRGGHRRQVETYCEGSWQNHPGVYRFEERFGPLTMSWSR